MTATNTPILLITPAVLDRLSFAELYHLYAALNGLESALGDGQVANQISNAVSGVGAYIEQRQAKTQEELLWKWVSVLGFAHPRDPARAVQFVAEAHELLGDAS